MTKNSIGQEEYSRPVNPLSSRHYFLMITCLIIAVFHLEDYYESVCIIISYHIISQEEQRQQDTNL